MFTRLSKSLDYVKESITGPNEKSVVDIFFACSKDGDVDTVRRLVEEGRVGVSAQNPAYYQWTALHYAAEVRPTCDALVVGCRVMQSRRSWPS